MSALNPAQLLRHFDRISEAPEAVQRLRRFILDLAVRGKLVEQNPSDEPAAELLKRIKEEMSSRIRSGLVKGQGPYSVVEGGEELFPVRRGWIWTRLGVIAQITMGQSPPGHTYNKMGEGIPLINGPVEFSAGPFGVTVVNQYTTEPTNLCEKGDLLICVRGSTTGRTNIAGFNACIGRGVAAIRPLFDDSYVRLFVWRLRDSILAMGRGIAFPSVSKKQIEELPIPLPPLAEQHSIVAKVEELMALCDQLEATQAKRESRRDRLVAGSLHRLSTPSDADEGNTQDVFRDHARFVFSQLPRLTTRPAHIKQLRQTILNLAVQGKLVAQDANNEPAVELLKQIILEQPHLSKKRRSVAIISNLCSPKNSKHFSIPSTWLWISLENVISFGPQNGISPKPSTDPDAPKAITLTATTSGIFNPHHYKKVDAKIPADSEFWLQPGDLLFQRGNTREYVGMAAYYEGAAGQFLFPDLMMKVRLSERVSLRYVHLCAIAPFARAYFGEHASGAQATMPKINQSSLVQLPIPLPPLAEQHRIVAKVDELMALCDQLESQLTTNEADSRRLLEAVLQEALSTPSS